MADKKDWLALSLLKNMGGAAFRRLIEHFPETDEIFKTDPKALRELIPNSRVEFNSMRDKTHREAVEKEIMLAKKNGVRIITWDDEEYPDALRAIYDPPVLLFAKGALSLHNIFSVAVVGSRKCSFYGQKMAREISRALCEAGVVVTSGLALGIDSAAHTGALSGPGRTAAVLGCGLAGIYPAQNKKMAQMIEANGVLISEFPMTMPPLKSNFPMRNRIISGLSRGVLVIEARENSGALITANCALDEGRDIFVLPGAADSAGFRGSHSLIKDGAKFVTSAADILDEFNIFPRDAAVFIGGENNPTFTRTENRIIAFLNSSPVHVDDIIEGSKLGAKETGSILSLLEVRGCVKRLPGNHFVRIS